MNDIDKANRLLNSISDENIFFEEELNSKDQPLEEAASNETKTKLPQIIDWNQFNVTSLTKPEVLIEGVLHRGSKMVLGGGSKSYKTWALADMALSVASGTPWWGIPCNLGVVCYVNLEIQDYFFKSRINEIITAKAVLVANGKFFLWNLRGYSTDLEEICETMVNEIKQIKPTLIIIDPIYKVMAGLDENKAGDISYILNQLDRLAVETDAAVVFGAHFAKGNASGKESLDRISGSGVFARDPDSIMTMTRHEEVNCFTVESTLRNFPPLSPFVVRREHPLMKRAPELDPKKLKSVGKPFEAKYSTDSLLKILSDKNLSYAEWKEQCLSSTAMSEGTFKNLRRKLEEEGQIEKFNDKYRIKKQG